MLTPRPLAPAALLVSLLTLSACATGEKRDDPQVHSLRLEGAHKVSQKDLKKKILTTQNSWIPFSRKQYFDEDEWKTDLRRIQRYYRARGFYQGKVLENSVTPHGKQVDVVAKVEEGQPTVVTSLNIHGLDDLPGDDRDALLHEVTIKTGQTFVLDRWEGLKAKLLTLLQEQGYAAATVAGEAKVGLDTQKADVTVEVNHGPRYKFGALSVKQQEHPRVSPWRIVEQAAAETPPGDWYSLKAQTEAEGRVFKMGVFGAVKMKPGEPDPGSLTVPLLVDVQEGRYHTLAAGGGLAIDQTRQEVRATAGYVNRDFLGGLRKLSVDATLGYAWIPTFYASAASGRQSGVVGSVSTELMQPRVFFRDLNFDTKASLEKGLEPAYSYYGARGKVGLPWTPTNHLTLSPSYNLEYYRLQSGSAQLNGRAPTLLFGCPENCLLSYLEESLEWDERNDRQEPKRGYYLALAFQEGGGVLGGSFDYLRVVPEARGYVSFLEEDVLTFAARLKAGSLIPTHGNDSASPIISRFYSGGNDMRGFNSRRLSPQFVVPVASSTTTGYTVPVGGDGLLEGSFETRYNVTGPLVVAAFFDTGFVTREHFTLKNNYIRDNLLFAVGTGVRYRTPLGPIRLDFGYRLDIGPPLPVFQAPGAPLAYPTRSSCFGLGKGGPSAGAPEGPCVIHLSIGEAF